MSYRGLVSLFNGPTLVADRGIMLNDWTEAEKLAEKAASHLRIQDAMDATADCRKTFRDEKSRQDWLEVFGDEHWTVTWTEHEGLTNIVIEHREGDRILFRREVDRAAPLHVDMAEIIIGRSMAD